jgi:uncharacterized membrane protein YfcA
MDDFLAAWGLAAVDEPVRYLVFGTVAALLVSMGKAGFGGGVGLLSYPLMIVACGDQTRKAAGIMLPLLVLCDYVSVLAWWRRWHIPAAMRLVPGMLAGLVIGFAALAAMGRLDELRGLRSGWPSPADATLMLLVGLIALGFVALQLSRQRTSSATRTSPLPTSADAGAPQPPAPRPGFWETAALGTAAGVTTMLAHAAGPIATIYMLRHDMPKDRFAATTSFFFWIANQIKIPLYVALGMMNRETLAAAVWLAPGIVAGSMLGVALNRRLRQTHFTGIVYVLLSVVGIHLIVKSIMAFRCLV